MAHGVLFRVL